VAKVVPTLVDLSALDAFQAGRVVQAADWAKLAESHNYLFA